MEDRGDWRVKCICLGGRWSSSSQRWQPRTWQPLVAVRTRNAERKHASLNVRHHQVVCSSLNVRVCAMERSLIVVQTVDRNPFRRERRVSTVTPGSPQRLVSVSVVTSVSRGVRSVVRSIRRRSRQHSCHAPLLLES